MKTYVDNLTNEIEEMEKETLKIKVNITHHFYMLIIIF